MKEDKIFISDLNVTIAPPYTKSMQEQKDEFKRERVGMIQWMNTFDLIHLFLLLLFEDDVQGVNKKAVERVQKIVE